MNNSCYSYGLLISNGLLLCSLYALWTRAQRPSQPERNASEAIEAVDTVGGWDDVAPRVDLLVDGELVMSEGDEYDEIRRMAEMGATVKVVPMETNRQFYRFAAVVAREVKARMGTPTMSAANWMVAHDLVQKVLAEKDVRKVDRAIFAPLACQMVFVPTKFDVHAAKFMRTDAVAGRQEEFMGTDGRSWLERLFGVRRKWKAPMIMRG